jgi:AcrR family transcriptional regulator
MDEAVAPPPSKRRARNSLTVEAILDAAERVALDGFEALTIRAVATDLRSSPMALYRYFGAKDELVDALLNRVLGRFDQPTETDDWVADLQLFARNHYSMLASQPWAIRPLISHPNPGMNALPIGETALRILARGGITNDAAVAAFSGIIALNYGWASFSAARLETSLDDREQSDGSVMMTPSEFPLTAKVASGLAKYGSHDHYELVLAQFLTGLQSTASSRARLRKSTA